VIIGVGNPFGGDDGAGIEVVRRLRARAQAGGIRVRELEGDPLALLDAFGGADAAILVDAVRSGAAAGGAHRADASAGPLPARRRGVASTHAVGVGEAIELARTLGRLPARVLLYGIEGERFDAGAGLSAAVGAAVDTLAERVLAEAFALRGGEERASR